MLFARRRHRALGLPLQHRRRRQGRHDTRPRAEAVPRRRRGPHVPALASDANVPILTGFVNSAPPRVHDQRQGVRRAAEARDGGRVRAVPRAASSQQLHDDDHITVNYVSPMNEPDDSFGDCGQEGMKVPVEQRAAVVQALGDGARRPRRRTPRSSPTRRRPTRSSPTKRRSGSPSRAPRSTSPRSRTTRTTSRTTRSAELLPPIATRFGKPTWMTEICCYKGSGGVASSLGAHYDPTMTQGFWLADQIYDDLTVAGDSAWYWWTALSPVLGCDPKADPRCATRENTEGLQRRAAVLRRALRDRRRHDDLPDQAVLRARSVQPLRAARRGAPRRDAARRRACA